MKAIYRHEIKSYFNGLTGCIFAAFILLFVGIFTTLINVKSASANFEYVLSNMSFVFIIAIPVLTMRTVAEERRQKTDKLLYSLPVSMTDVVLGKYAALLTVLAVPTLLIIFYPIILSAYGEVYLPAAFGAIVGFFFLGAALAAIGLFISSLTESQAVAAGICLVVMLLNYFLATISSYASITAFSSFAAFFILILVFSIIVFNMTKSGTAAGLTFLVPLAALILLYVLKGTAFEGLFSSVMNELSLFERFYVFVNGVFDLTGIVYFITVAAVFVFLSIQSMEKRRWSE